MRVVGLVYIFIVLTCTGMAIGMAPVKSPEQDARVLNTPDPVEQFTFAVLGDRVPGSDDGLGILDRAVSTCNHLGVRFVMTTGNMIDGKTRRASWDRRASAYRRSMSRLESPWYPVRGPRDAALRGEAKEESDRLYAERFGPSIYSFDVEWAHVIALPSEQLVRGGDSRERSIKWLSSDLRETDADQIFVVLHDPLWREDADLWQSVHALLVEDGRPTRVISGGTRYAREDRQRDNVRYTSVSMTGAFASDTHGYASSQSVTLINVERMGHELIVLPFDAASSGDSYLGHDADAVRALVESGWASIEGFLQAGPEPGDGAAFEVVLENPTERRIDYSVETIAPAGWVLTHNRVSGALETGQTLRIPVAADAPALGRDRPSVEVMLTVRYPISSGGEQSVVRRLVVPVRPRGAEAAAISTPDSNGVLSLSGNGAVRVDLGERPLQVTMECWVQGDSPSGNAAVLSRYADGMGAGIIWSRPRGVLPSAVVGTSRGIVRIGLDEPLNWQNWHHIAVTYNGSSAELFLDGVPVGASAGGDIATGDFPLYIGAEPNHRGDPVSFFKGKIDEVRVSSVVRYTERFTPERVFVPDGQTMLLLHFDTPYYGAHPDDSGRGNHAWATGDVQVIREARE